MNTHEAFTDERTSRELKELGFDWPCRRCWGKDHGVYTAVTGKYEDFNHKINGSVSESMTSAPTLDITQKWLREVHKFHIEICLSPFKPNYSASVYRIEDDGTSHMIFGRAIPESECYEEVQLNAIRKCLGFLEGVRVLTKISQ